MPTGMRAIEGGDLEGVFNSPPIRLPKKDTLDLLLDTVELYHPGVILPTDAFHPEVETARQKAIEETRS